MAASIGFKQIEIPDPGGQRPLHASLWYPTEDSSAEVEVGENPVFHGVGVISDARLEARPHALVLLSHGMGGSWRNLNWLAADLVARGYVVAAPDHPGTTFTDKRPSEAVRLWERPRDLSRVLDALVADKTLLGEFLPGRVAAVGHSLGGWTVIALAGGRFQSSLISGECPPANASPFCRTLRQLGLADAKSAPELAGNMRDPRIAAVVSLDPGAARGFTPKSLAAVPVPVLILAAGREIPEIAALKSDSAYLEKHLPAVSTHYAEIPDALHFTFMQLCKPGAVALIEREDPGEGYVCEDGGGRTREEIHRDVADRIIGFLDGALTRN